MKLLVSDIDGTLLDDGRSTPGLENLARLLAIFDRDVKLVYATGRSFDSTLALIRQGLLPRPDAIAPSVGTELWFAPWREPDEDFARHIDSGWDRDTVMGLTDGLGAAVRMQAPRFQGRHKVSLLTEDDAVPGRLEARLRRAGLATNVIYSGGRFLDVIPSRAGKANVVEHCRRRWGVARGDILTCGDSGNDLEMLSDPQTNGIVVGNAEPELDDITDADSVYEADLPHAAGVLEGAGAFGFWPAIPLPRGDHPLAGSAS